MGARTLPSLSLIAAVALVAHGADAPVDFARDIAPLFAEHCIDCHGAQGKPKGRLRLDRKAHAAEELVLGAFAANE